MLILPNYLTGEDISAVVVVMLIHFTAQAVRLFRAPDSDVFGANYMSLLVVSTSLTETMHN